jgi:gas vesicle protein
MAKSPGNKQASNFLRGKLIMLSSTVEEIKQDAKDVAGDISSRAQTVASDVSVETRETLGNVGDRIAREGVEIKSELELLLGKVYDLMRPEVSHEIRQHVRQSWDGFSNKVAAWAEGREGELATTLNNTQLRTRRVIAERPMTTLLVAAGTGALVAYWLSHRSPSTHDEQLH